MITVRTLQQVACAVAVLVVWQLVAVVGLAPSNLLPAFTSVASSLSELVTGSELWTAIGDTVGGALQGLVVAALVAVPLGLLAGLSPFLERSMRVLIDFGRSFPAIALMPVFVLLYGTTTTTKSIVVFVACTFPLFLQTLYGARRVDPSIVETTRSYRIPWRLFLLRVVLPNATPSIMTGLRLAATTAVLVAMATEVIGGIPGIGRQLSLAQADGATATAFAYFIVAGLLGFLVARGAELLETRLLRWRPAD